MKVLGIISEYNPLHSGHIYHIKASCEKTSATHTLCIMSGQFVQRGEPAIVDKWARTRMALNAGIDLVLELPVVFSCASAEIFAYGAVRTLQQTGIVDYLSFGSEQGELGSLWRIASVLYEEPTEYRKLLKQFLNEGLSFPVAREKALNLHLRELPGNIMDQSNNILAIEYLKALKHLGSSIQPVTVRRQGSSYNNNEITSFYSSASAIRSFINNNKTLSESAMTDNLPPATTDILNECFNKLRGPVFSEHFSNIIMHLLRSMEPVNLKQVPDVNEGLENRLVSCAMQTGVLKDFLDLVATSRYPSTRIKRITANLLWGITKDRLKRILEDKNCGYLRVLGFNNKGIELLQKMYSSASVPIIVRVSSYRNQLSDLAKEMFEYDIRATNAYVMAFSDPTQRKGDQDFTTPIIRI
ncbi:MAG: nucleotidyltransferase [Ruminiclostridium sp.]|nr:nucleotidyltransferase [Ruminiclostridium sp.]